MTDEEIKHELERAGTIGKVRHVDYAAYIKVMPRRKKVNDEWFTEEHCYMLVSGRVKMANDDHNAQDATWNVLEPKILVNTDDALTLSVTLKSTLYGLRTATDSSRKKTGPQVERDYPFEIAETSAIGRALGLYNYGCLPESGLTSADDMARVQNGVDRPHENHPKSKVTSRKRDPKEIERAALFQWCEKNGIPLSTATDTLKKHNGDVGATTAYLKKVLEQEHT